MSMMKRISSVIGQLMAFLSAEVGYLRSASAFFTSASLYPFSSVGPIFRITLSGEVALPSLKLPGHGSISAVANWVTFTPDSRTVYISNAGLRSVSAIDTQSMKLIAVVPVGEVPKRINTLVIPDLPGSAATSSEKRASLR